MVDCPHRQEVVHKTDGEPGLSIAGLPAIALTFDESGGAGLR
jgi:hypothetical protein